MTIMGESLRLWSGDQSETLISSLWILQLTYLDGPPKVPRSDLLGCGIKSVFLTISTHGWKVKKRKQHILSDVDRKNWRSCNLKSTVQSESFKR